MMHMTFYWSKNVTLLLNSWRTSTWLSYSATLIACFLFSAFLQFLEHRRITLTVTLNPYTVKTPMLRSNPFGMFSLTKSVSAALFGLNAAIGYLLMLAVMSFNGGVFVSIVSGLATGYFFFRCGGEEAGLEVENPCACA